MAVRTKFPLPAELEAGKSYSWCACGKSQAMPLCDGSHKKTDKNPITFIAEATKTTYLCGCACTKNTPLCDGSHCKADF
ncbi:MAG: CDGSH iron-sulfur domain-containing protein [Methylococcales bacterium]|nr:CDGSH iron-sulfur domain-containing protein [Methylococcales bacterium]